MSAILDAVNSQLDQSIYSNRSSEDRFVVISQCEFLKKITMITAIAAPIFAFYFPAIFGVVSCFTLGLIAYDLFNMIDNFGDAVRMSVAGVRFRPQSHIAALLEGTFTGWILSEYLHK